VRTHGTKLATGAAGVGSSIPSAARRASTLVVIVA
jgi:hypothetical protein